MPLSIALKISNVLEKNRFMSLFEIIPPRLSSDWSIDKYERADVIVIDGESPGSQYFLESCKKNTSALPLLYADENTLNSEWFLKKPVRASSLVEILNDISVKL